ncbi:anti-sigma W factor [Gordoniibacillus kamchatkensis]|uniref:Anti-sigma-W factor RsiW n=1 Tax=Gordoniibacillus kamchatkensis TaxID=1590651 RepID=A0ABR5AAJ1_9BACL|nr:zf-HC2 domain-containing protein [Paenibacillus sp. VKM B-2647]KIL37997.1 anti-sigma W factor [Paenibacillus sp. VKM B-2647]
MNCRDAIPLMHEYLDGDLPGTEAAKLKEHMLACRDCRAMFEQFEKTEALVRSLTPAPVPDDLTPKIMSGIPKPRRRSGWLRWVRRHPAVSVAAVFVAVMLVSFASLWNQDAELAVKGADLDQVQIHGHTVIVPQGRTVHGNLVVENGEVRVDGEVTGNLTVIDGTVNMASTAHIAGQIKQVDQALDYVWYKLNEWAGLIAR